MTLRTNERVAYGVEVDWQSLPPHTNTLVNIGEDVTALRFRRVKQSHRGIRRLTNLQLLVSFCVNQEFLEEISELPRLTTLYIDTLSATDLTPLGRCTRLRHLTIKGGTKIANLDWVQGLPQLESLLIESFKLVRDISSLGSLKTIRALGVEGSIWTTQKVNSLLPISKLSELEALFIMNCRPEKDGLQPLHALPGLRYLEAPAFFSDSEFLALRAANPHLTCQWFTNIDRYGSIKAAIKAITSQA